MPGPDPFEQQNAAFIDWLVNARGAEINPKVVLTDLRVRGSGRGVGMFSQRRDIYIIT